MNPRNAAPWGLAALACAAISLGFRANETAPQPAEAARTATAVRVARAVRSEAAFDSAAALGADAVVSGLDCRARAAVLQVPHGAGGGITLRRAQLSRGEPGLLMPKDAASAACARVTPGALPSMQPPVSSAH